MRPPGRLPWVRRLPPRFTRVDPKTVFFDSWRGKYADSPRAISEELRRRDPSFNHVWLVEEDDPNVPAFVEVVKPNSVQHLRSLGRARYVVANAGMPIYWRKKPEQSYLQTWHGTPLKKVAYDIPAPQMSDGRRYLRHFARDVAYWDLLLSQNRFSTEVLRRAFHYEGPILEGGYPRNDLLVSQDAHRVREDTRRALGLADGVCAVLYAPTWRDNAAFDIGLDIDELVNQLGNDFVVLLRAHNHVAKTVARQSHPGVLDVSRIPDTRELLLAADVLVTDYSSVMFDFAVTGRPILLYVYDIEHYRDDLRGMYLELADEAPSPLLRTPSELLGALRNLDETVDAQRTAYARFSARYCALDDGTASSRAVEAFFGLLG